MKDLSKTFEFEMKDGSIIKVEVDYVHNIRAGYCWEKDVTIIKDSKEFKALIDGQGRLESTSFAKYMGHDLRTAYPVGDTFDPVDEYIMKHRKRQGKETAEFWAEQEKQEMIRNL